jgi:hypothetical protein
MAGLIQNPFKYKLISEDNDTCPESLASRAAVGALCSNNIGFCSDAGND